MAHWNAYTPTNRVILSGGETQEVGEDLKCTSTMTYMKPGALVEKGASDDEVVIAAGSNMPIGVLGYEKTGILIRPITIGTAYNVNDRAFIHEGVGLVVYGWLGTGCTKAVVKGDPAYLDANGCVKTAGSGTVVGYFVESMTSSGTPKRVKYKKTV